MTWDAIEGNWLEHVRLGQEKTVAVTGRIEARASTGFALPEFCRRDPSTLNLVETMTCAFFESGTTEGQRRLEEDMQRRREARQSRNERIRRLNDDLGSSQRELRSIISRGRWSESRSDLSCNVLGAALYPGPCSPERILTDIWQKHLYEVAAVRLGSAARSIPDPSQRLQWFSAVVNWISVANGSMGISKRFLGHPPAAKNMFDGMFNGARTRGRFLYWPFNIENIWALNRGYPGRNEGPAYSPISVAVGPLTRAGCGGIFQPPCPAGGGRRRRLFIQPRTLSSTLAGMSLSQAMFAMMRDTSSGLLIPMERVSSHPDANKWFLPTWTSMQNYLLAWAREYTTRSFEQHISRATNNYIQYLDSFPPETRRDMRSARDRLRSTVAAMSAAGATAASLAPAAAGFIAVTTAAIGVIAEILPLASGGVCPYVPVPFLLRAIDDPSCVIDLETAFPSEDGAAPDIPSNLPILIGGAIGAAALALLLARS